MGNEKQSQRTHEGICPACGIPDASRGGGPTSARSKLLASLLSALLLSAGCGSSNAISDRADVRVGLFPNLTHAPAILCVAEGTFQSNLGSRVGLDVKIFTSGPQAVEALFAGAVDVAYLGPVPAVNAFLRSRGDALRIVAGAASGGSAFVVRPEVATLSDLVGKTVATPQIGNTQDVALRSFLHERGLGGRLREKGAIGVASKENSQIFEAFRAGDLAGAWVPEPWTSRLVLEASGRVLVDEKGMWPEGQFATTVMTMTPRFMDAEPEAARALVRANAECVERLASGDPTARRMVGSWIAATTGRALQEAVMDRAWGELSFTIDPLFETIEKRAGQAAELGIVRAFDHEELERILAKP